MIKNRFSVFCGCIGTAICLNSLMIDNVNPVSAFTISDSVSGSVSPPVTTTSNTLVNGDFLITAPSRPGVGDGFDEITTWTFDFTSFLGDIPTSPILNSALFTITITPGSTGVVSDTIAIEGLNPRGIPEIRSTLFGQTNTVVVELLDIYSSEEILGVFSSDVSGELPFIYGDDSVVSFSQLDLTFHEPIPEPLTILGTFTALGFGALLKRKTA